MAHGQRESLSHSLSPVGYNVLSNSFITYLCPNLFFDNIGKCLRISDECLFEAARKARNRIIKRRNRIASGSRLREFCNQRGVLELPAGFPAQEQRGSRSYSTFFLSFFTCFDFYVLSYIHITCLCPISICVQYGKSLIKRGLQRFRIIKRGVIECKGGEIELTSQRNKASFGIRREFYNHIYKGSLCQGRERNRKSQMT